MNMRAYLIILNKNVEKYLHLLVLASLIRNYSNLDR